MKDKSSKTLQKYEDLLKENEYQVRYSKGNFKSGYCVLEQKKVVVVNKFTTTESRIIALAEIVQRLSQNPDFKAESHPELIESITVE